MPSVSSSDSVVYPCVYKAMSGCDKRASNLVQRFSMVLEFTLVYVEDPANCLTVWVATNKTCSVVAISRAILPSDAPGVVVPPGADPGPTLLRV